MKKKLCAALLAAAMCVSLMPAAYAEEAAVQDVPASILALDEDTSRMQISISPEATIEIDTGAAAEGEVSTSETALDTQDASYYQPTTIYYPPDEVNLNETELTMQPDGQATLTATIKPSYVTEKALRWGSNDHNIVTVEAGMDGKAYLTAHNPGTTHVWVETQNSKGDHVSASCKVKVGVDVQYIQLSANSMRMRFGDSGNIVATVYPTNATNKTVTWKSSNEAVVTVDSNGSLHAVRAGTATITATSNNNKTATCTVQVDPDAALVITLVTRLYENCLNRAPDTAGLNDWVARLAAGTTNGTDAAVGFVFSQEFKNMNLCNRHYVERLYRAFMGREPDQAGLDYWVGRLTGGTTREEVFNGFAQSAEFNGFCAGAGIQLGDPTAVPKYGTVPTGPCSVCGEVDGVTQFVTRMYEVCLDRQPDAAGLSYWTNGLWSHSRSGSNVASGFIFSQEFINKNYNNSDYTEHLYKAFMGRDSDAAGKAYWVAKLDAGESRESVFNGFVRSQEFTNICNSYGIVRE